MSSTNPASSDSESDWAGPHIKRNKKTCITYGVTIIFPSTVLRVLKKTTILFLFNSFQFFLIFFLNSVGEKQLWEYAKILGLF